MHTYIMQQIIPTTLTKGAVITRLLEGTPCLAELDTAARSCKHGIEYELRLKSKHPKLNIWSYIKRWSIRVKIPHYEAVFFPAEHAIIQGFERWALDDTRIFDVVTAHHWDRGYLSRGERRICLLGRPIMVKGTWKLIGELDSAGEPGEAEFSIDVHVPLHVLDEKLK
jgi:hypothetical protein